MNANLFTVNAIAGRFGWPGRAVPALLTAILCLLCLSTCGDPEHKQKQQLAQAVDQVTRIVNDASRKPLAAVALQSTFEGGGTLLNYVVNSLPDQFSHRVYTDRPEAAWSVVLRLSGSPGEAIVEGYGSDLTKPLFTRSAKFGSPPERR